MIHRALLNEWANVVKQKSWKFEDTVSLGQSNHLVYLLNSIFPVPKPPFKAEESIQLPAGFHFLFNNQSNLRLGVDGYDDYQAPADVSNGSSLFRRRLWAKGRISYSKRPSIGSTMICRERIASVRSMGSSAFVGIERQFEDLARRPILHEERTLVYTNEPFRGEQKIRVKEFAADPDASLNLIVSKEHVMKYSFLTYNMHKIHFDENYCRLQDNLPTTILQGPFMITLLLSWFEQLHPGLAIDVFTYKNLEPCLVGEALKLVCTKQDANRYQVNILRKDLAKCYLQGDVNTSTSHTVI